MESLPPCFLGLLPLGPSDPGADRRSSRLRRRRRRRHRRRTKRRRSRPRRRCVFSRRSRLEAWKGRRTRNSGCEFLALPPLQTAVAKSPPLPLPTTTTKPSCSRRPISPAPPALQHFEAPKTEMIPTESLIEPGRGAAPPGRRAPAPKMTRPAFDRSMRGANPLCRETNDQRGGGERSLIFLRGRLLLFFFFYRVEYTGHSASASPSTTTTTEPLFQARVPSFARTNEVGSVSPFSPVAAASLVFFVDTTPSPPPPAPPLRSPSRLCFCCFCCICNICSSSPDDEELEERDGEDDDDENTLPKGKNLFDTTATSTSTSSPASSGALNRSDCDR